MEEKRRALRVRSPVPSTLMRGFFFSFLRRKEIGIHDYIINIHVTRRVPRQCSPYTSQRSSAYLCIVYPRSRHNARSRCAFVSRRTAGTISASTYTDIYSRRQPTARSKRGATFLLSFCLPPFFLSSSLERCSRARARRAHGALNTIKTFNGN